MNDLEPVHRLTRDIAKSASLLSDDEARFLVDYYYICQEDRKRSTNQTRALSETQEPCMVVAWLAEQSTTLENQIKRALDIYTDAHPVGQWLKGVYGIGPVIAAGLLAHIDITKAPTAGHIWRYAGLDPTVKWEKGQKRPWNAGLKTLCCHPQTMVLTERGNKPIAEIAVGDVVLTHKGRWRKVSGVARSDHVGGLVGLRTFGASQGALYVTDNHPVYAEIRNQWVATKGREVASFGAADRVLRSNCLPDEQIRVMREERASGQKLTALAERYGCSTAAVSMICSGKNRSKAMENERMWVRSDGILPGWLLSYPRMPHGPMRTLTPQVLGGKCKVLPESILVDEEIARFLGLFMAEGHVSGNCSGFSFHVAEVDYQAFVIDVARRRFGLHVHPSVNTPHNSWQGIISSKSFAHLMSASLGKGSFSMRIPDSVMHGPAAVKSAFLRGWFEGDGACEYGQLTTSSVPHDAHALLVSIGIASSISPYQNSYKLSASRKAIDDLLFDGSLGIQETRSALRRVEPEAVWAQARESSQIFYSGPVYNLEVEEDHSYVANGVAVHNCWKAGQSFMKFSNQEECFYGHAYKERKAYEVARNDRGDNAALAATLLPKVGKTTEAHKHLSAGVLPPGQIDARARRWAVKLLLSHLHGEWFKSTYGTPPPLPYPIAIGGHAHYIAPPHLLAA